VHSLLCIGTAGTCSGTVFGGQINDMLIIHLVIVLGATTIRNTGIL
jgi:hypothetical protein